MDPSSQEDGHTKACALIRANFHVDPWTLQEDQWARLAAEAIWVEQFRVERMARLMAQMPSTNKEDG